MKTLKAYGDELQADTVTKTEDTVVGYVEGREVFRYSGIRDFSHFELVGEWDPAPLSDKEIIAQQQRQIDALMKRLDSNENAVLSLMDISMMGGMM